jgi:NAD(P)-dependent dehydrogenase (short-subunit alcohol dehydrogenase family)
MGKPYIAMVTGASAGLGRAIARAFGRDGASVGLIARNAKTLELARTEVEQLGGKALVLPLDVSDPDAVDRAASDVERSFGPIDVWVNNAMVSVFSPVKEMLAEEYRRVIEVNYLGYVYGTQAAIRRMLPRNRGRIIQVSSALAIRSIPLQSAYCASKHAIVGFTDSLRCELYHEKSEIEISVVHMPAMNTPQFTWVKSRLDRKPQPVPPIYEPEVGAQVVLHAARSRFPRREYWVAASTTKAILGQKIAPGLLDRYLGKTGYDAQQRDEKEDPGRLNNLWECVPEDRGAHGPFDAEARKASRQVQLNLHRSWLFGALALAGLWFGMRKLH